jgi:hypothetical protein
MELDAAGFLGLKERSNITASMLSWLEREKQHCCLNASLASKREATLLLRCFLDVKKRSNITASFLP